MELWQIMLGFFTGTLALLAGVYASFTARQKGPIFSNAYLWASEREKKTVDKKAEYRLITVVFGCLAVFFVLETVYIFTMNVWPLVLGFCVLGFILVYTIANAVRAKKNSPEKF